MPDDIPCYLKPFLRIKHIDGTGKECLINYTCGYACAKCLVIPVEDFEMFIRYGPFLWLGGCLGVESRKKRVKLT